MPILDPAWLRAERAAEPAYLAVVDVLGYAQLADSSDLRRLIRLLGSFRNAANLGAYKGIGAPRDEPRLRVIHYADTVLLAATGDSPQDLRSLIRGVQTLLRHTIPIGIGMRGAVVRGELFISDGEPEFPATFQGKGLVRAHQLERGQDWCGVVIDKETIGTAEECAVLAQLEKEEALREYDVPCKAGGYIRRHAVVWKPMAATTWQHVESSRDNVYGKLTDCRALKKWDAARKFFDTPPTDSG